MDVSVANQPPPSPVLFAIPVFIVTLLAERYLRKKQGLSYNDSDAITSILMGLGYVFQGALLTGVVWSVWQIVASHALVKMDKTLTTYLLLFVAEDFCYYWFHRLSHQIRVWWASHVNHHSSQSYNLAAALRQSWTGLVAMTWIVWLPLAWLGFPPEWVFIQQAVSLLYQYWIHTELVVKLPAWAEFVFNTPSHHRVHHGKNVRYLDSNYGGILIIWDRLFGTFVAEVEPVKYGLTKDLTMKQTRNIWQVSFHEWIDIAKDLQRASSAREVFGFLFFRPGWSADGSSKTSVELKSQSENLSN